MQEGIFENEREGAEVSAALGNLKKVSAPANFEANVRSVIEERSRRSFFGAPGFLLGLKFAVPAAVLLVLGAFLLFSNGGVEDGQIAVSDPIAQPAAVNVTSELPAVDPASAVQANSVIAEAGQVNNQVPINRPARSNPTAANGQVFQGGSRDMALSPDNTSVMPKGVDPKTNSAAPLGSLTAESILSKMGISARCVDDGCAASAVRSNSFAEKSGIKKGDVIEAIDGNPVNAGTIFEGNIIFRNVSVVRDGKRITVPLNTK